MEAALGEGDDVAVEPGGEVAVGVEDGDVVRGDAEAGDGDEAHERPVADEQCGGDGEQSAGCCWVQEADEAGDRDSRGRCG